MEGGSASPLRSHAPSPQGGASRQRSQTRQVSPNRRQDDQGLQHAAGPLPGDAGQSSEGAGDGRIREAAVRPPAAMLVGGAAAAAVPSQGAGAAGTSDAVRLEPPPDQTSLMMMVVSSLRDITEGQQKLEQRQQHLERGIADSRVDVQQGQQTVQSM